MKLFSSSVSTGVVRFPCQQDSIACHQPYNNNNCQHFLRISIFALKSTPLNDWIFQTASKSIDWLKKLRGNEGWQPSSLIEVFKAFADQNLQFSQSRIFNLATLDQIEFFI